MNGDVEQGEDKTDDEVQRFKDFVGQFEDDSGTECEGVETSLEAVYDVYEEDGPHSYVCNT